MYEPVKKYSKFHKTFVLYNKSPYGQGLAIICNLLLGFLTHITNLHFPQNSLLLTNFIMNTPALIHQKQLFNHYTWHVCGLHTHRLLNMTQT